MAIINMASNDLNRTDYPEGSYIPLNEKANPYVLFETYVGMCLRDFERNRYDDSDFYMEVWTGHGVRTIQFATTRAWSYPCYGSKPDASPEIHAKAEAWTKRYNMGQSLLKKRRQLHKDLEKARKMQITLKQFREIQRLDSIQQQAAEILLPVKNFRSEFRKSLATQIRNWLNGDRKFDQPLSYKQALTIAG